MPRFDFNVEEVVYLDLVDDQVRFYVLRRLGTTAAKGTFSAEALRQASGSAILIHNKVDGQVVAYLKVTVRGCRWCEVEVIKEDCFGQKPDASRTTLTLQLPGPDDEAHPSSPTTNLTTEFQQMRISPHHSVRASQVVETLHCCLHPKCAQLRLADLFPSSSMHPCGPGGAKIQVYSYERITGTKSDTFSLGHDDTLELVILHVRVRSAFVVGRLISSGGPADNGLVLYLPDGSSRYATQRKRRNANDPKVIRVDFPVLQDPFKTVANVLAMIAAVARGGRPPAVGEWV